MGQTALRGNWSSKWWNISIYRSRKYSHGYVVLSIFGIRQSSFRDGDLGPIPLSSIDMYQKRRAEPIIYKIYFDSMLCKAMALTESTNFTK